MEIGSEEKPYLHNRQTRIRGSRPHYPPLEKKYTCGCVCWAIGDRPARRVETSVEPGHEHKPLVKWKLPSG